MAKHRWEKPRVMNTDALSDGFGHCVEGGTASEFLCALGDNTAGGTGEGPHRCANGGYAGAEYGGCALGKSPDGSTPV